MAGIFTWRNFAHVDINDSFFDSLKADYPEFTQWFARKSSEGAQALVYSDDNGIGAFLYLKQENEEIVTTDNKYPAVPRIKIGTLKLAERTRGQRLGEGAVGIALWHWQNTRVAEIYITVFKKHDSLINLLARFGFINIGENNRGEYILCRQRNKIDYSTPFSSFPFITPHIQTAGIIPIYAHFHDRLFPYSELKGNSVEIEEETALKGITKIFIGTPSTPIELKIGDPVFIYRIDESTGQKTYRSAITSFCTVSNFRTIIKNNRQLVGRDEYLHFTGNKTVFTDEELMSVYSKPNLVAIEMVYNGYFGKGNNVIHRWLDDNGLFPQHPYGIRYSKDEFISILRKGNVDVSNVIVD